MEDDVCLVERKANRLLTRARDMAQQKYRAEEQVKSEASNAGLFTAKFQPYSPMI